MAKAEPRRKYSLAAPHNLASNFGESFFFRSWFEMRRYPVWISSFQTEALAEKIRRSAPTQ